MRPVERLAALTIIAALLAADTIIAGQASSAAVTKTVRPSDVSLSEFCDAGPSEAPAIAIAGPRLQWTRPLPPGRSPGEIVRVALGDPLRYVAVSARWLAIHDGSRGTLMRADCETGETENMTQSRPITALAVSQFGDIAEQAADGATIIFPRQVTGYTGREGQSIERSPEATRGARVLLWSGRRLQIVSERDILTFDVAPSQVARGAAPVTALMRTPDAAFVFKGLTYVANGPCIDVFVGTALTPRLRQAGCLRQPLTPASALLATQSTLEVIDSGGATVEKMPRPSVAHAKISGTTWDITERLLSLMEHPAIPVVPLRSAPPARLLAAPDAWSILLPKSYWNVSGGYERMLRAVGTKGWTDLRDERKETGWAAGNGVAVAWRRGSSLVAPRNRTLKVLAKLTDQEEFTDEQVSRIIADNSALADTVEGAFIDAGWVPVGSLFGGDTSLPPALVTPEALTNLIRGSERPGAADVREVISPSTVCRTPPRAVPDKRLTSLFASGYPAAGAVDGANSESPIVRAEEVVVLDCAGRLPIQIALLTNMKATFPVGKVTRSVSRAIVAVKGLPPDVTNALTRSWLDRLLRMRGQLPSLLLPTTSLELEFVVNAGTTLAELQKSGIQLASAESAPAAGRERLAPQPDPCTVVAEALKGRLRDEAAMSLASLDFQARRLTPPLKIAIAENAVPLLSPLFTRGGQPLWVEPKETGGFGPIETPLATDPTTRAARFLRHGSQVAGLIVVAKDTVVRGVLADAALVWIDTMDSPSNNTPLLNKLFSKKAIVNVSDRLDFAWSSLSTNNVGWTSNLLFVAAVKNIGENTDGPPLTWTERANVVGVGLVDGNGTLLPGSTYDSDIVDLVAPGAAVPTVDDGEALGCSDGTSFATAYVSAVAAMLAERAPRNWTVGQLRSRLLSTADWKPEYSGKVKGGLVDAERALNNLDKNVLVVDRGAQPPLEMDVVWEDGREFDISGSEKPGSSPVNHRIQWSDVLRWQTVDTNGVKSVRVSFIRNNKYTVLENATIAGRQGLPLRSCLSHKTPANAVGCTGMRPEQIREYTGALYAQSSPVKF